MVPLSVLADVRNGGFSEGLLFWKTAWHAAVVGGELALSDVAAPQAFAFQAAALGGATNVSVEFDFYNGLAPTNAPGSFRDSFYASLYEVDDPAGFVLEHDKFGTARGMMDLDAGGPFDVHGSVTNSAKGAGWLRFSGTFSTARPFLVVVFELYDLNLSAGDSAVRIDNVSVRP
jgi:hypothetical protein